MILAQMDDHTILAVVSIVASTILAYFQFQLKRELMRNTRTTEQAVASADKAVTIASVAAMPAVKADRTGEVVEHARRTLNRLLDKADGSAVLPSPPPEDRP